MGSKPAGSSFDNAGVKAAANSASLGFDLASTPRWPTDHDHRSAP
jgi:hypothetical protein